MKQKEFKFYKLSSRLVKIAAWTFLLFGISHGVGLFFVGQARWLGVPMIVLYAFGVFLIYLVAMIADLLLEIWQFLKKERF